MNLALAFFCACNNLPMPPQAPAAVAPVQQVVAAEAPAQRSSTRAVVDAIGTFGDMDFFTRLGEAVVDDINGVRKGMGLASLQQAAAKKIADREQGVVVKDDFKSPDEIMAVTRSMFRGNDCTS